MKTRTVKDGPFVDSDDITKVCVSDVAASDRLALWLSQPGCSTVAAHLTVEQAKQVVKNLKRVIRNEQYR